MPTSMTSKRQVRGRELILGGNGFIGSHLADRVLALGRNVTILDKAMEQYRAPLPGVKYVLGSFEDRSVLDDALTGVDTVFHLISTTLPKGSNENPAFDIGSNLVGTIRLLEACVERSVRKVVFVSSGGTVYGSPTVIPIPETHATEPECSYGIGKLAIEKYLALFHKLHGLDYVILRPSNPYGARQNPLGSQGIVAVFLGKLREHMPIEIWGDGEIVRDYLHVTDLVEGMCQAAFRSTPSRIFNLGMGVGHSINDLCRAIEHVLGRELDVRYSPRRIFDVGSIVLDTTRARRELNWEPRIKLDAGLRDVWDFVNRAALRT